MYGNLLNLAGGIWFSMSNGTLVTALLVSFAVGFVAGVAALAWMNGRHKR